MHPRSVPPSPLQLRFERESDGSGPQRTRNVETPRICVWCGERMKYNYSSLGCFQVTLRSQVHTPAGHAVQDGPCTVMK